MNPWQFWWNTFVLSSQHNPPRFVELLMLLLAMAMLSIWIAIGKLPFLILSLSYVMGSSTSILVREAIAPSHQPRLMQVVALLALIYSSIALWQSLNFSPWS